MKAVLSLVTVLSRNCLRLFLFALTAGIASPAFAADHFQPANGPFATALTDALIDDQASAEWVDGADRRPATPVRSVVWTLSTVPPGNFLSWGGSSTPGVRHLRLGLKGPLTIGSILVRGGDTLSVLRPGAPYPGNLSDDSQWLPAERVVSPQSSSRDTSGAGATPVSATLISRSPVDVGHYAIWSLPAVTSTRAIRFTHVSSPTDSSYAATLGGVYLLSGRFANLAPQAAVTTSANSGSAPLLVNEKHDDWQTWDNGPTFPHPVAAATPEWITLTWPRTVSLSGLATLWTGFNQATAQYLPEGKTSLDAAADSDWQNLATLNTHSQYPRPLGVDWIDFGKTIHTRAIRLRITQVTDEAHASHLAGKTHNGNRVWLGELMALTPLGSSQLAAAKPPPAAPSSLHPPIPVNFTLKAAGFVSLVIDDAQGNRVRNLVSDTHFNAGPNTVWWDGSDDLGRNPEAAAHGVGLIPIHYVAPGHYTVRGITHQQIDLHYELTVYNPGNPPWETVDTRGGWLTNHTPPSAALFLPADHAPGGKPLIYLGSWVSEGGAGLAWVNLDGQKQGGRGWIGGAWTAAPFLARDASAPAFKDSDIYAYVGSIWQADLPKNPDPKQVVAVVRITGLTQHGDKAVFSYQFKPGENLSLQDNGRPNWPEQMGGLAILNHLAVISLTRGGQLLFGDTVSGKTLGLLPVPSPRGVAFDSQGRLLVVSGTKLLRYNLPKAPGEVDPARIPSPETVIAAGLEDPGGITVDTDGTVYISDQGSSNQVKVFTPAGKPIRTVGHAGPSKAGPYDPDHMNYPHGLAVDSSGNLWVSEEDFQPKRVSLWSPSGKLLKAFYGPSEYGGGGALDPRDKTRFYYHAMEFKLDWQSGQSSISSVLFRPSKEDLPLPPYAGPESPLYSHGHRYFTNSFLGYPTNGVTVLVLYLDSGGTIRPVSAFGRANSWKLLASAPFQAKWPKVRSYSSLAPDDSVLFTWSDLNGNGRVDPDEVAFTKAATGTLTMLSDPAKPDPVKTASTLPPLAIYDSYLDGNAVRFAPSRITADGVPVYDLSKFEVLVKGAQPARSDGGGQILFNPANTVLTTAPTPFPPESVGGIDAQGHRWSYPSLWPGLHPAHSAPVADHPGELIGTTRLLGEWVHLSGSTAPPLWAINGNFGNIYLFTADGFFVTELLRDVRTGKPWNMPSAPRNMLLNDISPHDENFFPSLTQTSDGNVYLNDGGRTSLIRVDGLGSVVPIASTALEITSRQLDQARQYLGAQEAERQSQTGRKTLEVALHTGPAPSLENLFSALSLAQWAPVDRRINQVGWAGLPDDVEAAVTVAGGRLFAAWRTSNPTLIVNSGAIANAPFKSGGALDLMIGADSTANPRRTTPVPGDSRLLVFLVNGVPHATLYRAVVPGTTNTVPFASPGRSITFDKVEDVTSQLQFHQSKGEYAISVPLTMLGLNPVADQRIKADIGILRGSPVQTLQRVYWSNKASGITSDVPSEAELTPNLWGEFHFHQQP